MNPLGPCMGYRAVSTTDGAATPYIYSSYTEIVTRVDAIAAGLEKLGIVERNEDGLLLLGIYLKNCVEWVLCEHAIYALSGATVPFYDTLGPNTVSFILDQTNLSCVICARSELKTLIASKKKLEESGQPSKFRHVVLVDGVTPEAAAACEAAGIIPTSLGRVEALGAQISHAHKHTPPSSTDVATFCYTSGTTGNPKGAMLSHLNLCSTAAGMQSFGDVIEFNAQDRHLSYLPLPHIFERIVMVGLLVNGASIGFFRGDAKLLVEDLVALRPTIMPAAPRVLNKIYDKIMAGIAQAGGLKQKLFNQALATKRYNLVHHNQLTHSIYDALLFHKVSKALGLDAIRVLVSGSAPLSPNVMSFFRCLLSAPVIEGYGQTEGSAAATISHPGDCSTLGHVGGPVDCVEILLADVSEMGYLRTDTMHNATECRGRGEIWIRGPNVFMKYYKEPEKTAETMEMNIAGGGWLKTGDVGLWTMEGNLQIIDRKKNIFKLSQGEYVAAEKIENVLMQSRFIGQCFVYGDSYQSCLVAIIVPDEDVVTSWSSERGNTNTTLSQLCQDAQLRSEIMQDIKTVSKTNGLHGFETPKAIYLESEIFGVENGLTTPTFKLKRQQLKQRYQKDIDRLYAEIPPPSSKL
eukprot:CAMPEP_0194357300 /NCGR_PEP_ID=MMETSP0174-20130528/4799_1 /TAXON_ID=216777 /ORGANISM="Proboscia alata, Strain PI-D3" /LENGTH=633 /DNA_ID=CAMNT_0039127253 /DNA_START=221 /DNA_END=2122 /DNA_ORIENTATION=-